MTGASLAGGTSSIESLISQYMLIERQPILKLQVRKSDLNARSAMFTDLKLKLSALEIAAKALADAGDTSVFASKSVVSSNQSAVSATAGSSAPPGSYSIEVATLATAHRVQSDRQASATDSTGFTGTIRVQDALIEIDAENNSLIGIRDAINAASYAAGRGVRASVVDNRLVVQSLSTGAANRVALADLSGSVLQGLGLVTAGSAPLAVAAAAASSQAEGQEAGKAVDGLRGHVNAWRSAVAATSQEPVWLQLDLGVSRTVSRVEWGRDEPGGSNSGVPKDYAIQVSADGVNWTAVKSVDGHAFEMAGDRRTDLFAPVAARYVRMSITATNDGEPPAVDEIAVYDDTDRFGANELQTPRDSAFSIDGVAIQRAANAGISDVLEGVTLNLQAPTTAEVSLDVKPNASAITGKIEAFLAALNDVTSYIKARSTVNTITYSRGALSGEYAYTSLRMDLLRMTSVRVSPAAEGDPAYLSDIGIEFGADLAAKIQDKTKLADALTRDPGAVAALFNRASTGIANRIVDRLAPYVASSGLLDGEVSQIADEISALDGRTRRMEERLSLREAQLRREFTALQRMLNAVMQQQMSLQAVLFASVPMTGSGGGSGGGLIF